MPVRNPQRRNQRAYNRRKGRDLVYKVAGRRNCFMYGSDENITVHHVDGDITNNSLGNLMSLCIVCHRKVEEEPKPTTQSIKEEVK